MNTKAIIAVIVVVIVVVAGCGVVLMNNSNSTNTSTYTHTFNTNDEKLAVFGNANVDTAIDSKDVTAINNLIKDGAVSRADNQELYEKNYLADANQDKVIDSKDVEYVNTMINGTATTVYYENVEGSAVAFKVAEKNYIIAGHRTYGRSAVLLANASDNVKIVGSTNNSVFETEFSDVIDQSIIEDVGTQGSPTVEKISNISEKYSDGNVLFLTGQNSYYCDGYESKFVNTNVQFVRMIAWEGSSLTGLLTVGYLIDGVGNNGSTGSFGQAKAYETFYHKYADPITNYVSTLKDSDKTTVITTYMAKEYTNTSGNKVTIDGLVTQATSNSFRNETSSDYQMTILAGGDNVLRWFQQGGGTEYGGNSTWTFESLAAGLQGNDLDVLIVGAGMYIGSDVRATYESVASQIAVALTGWVGSDVEIYVKNYNFTGIPCFVDLLYNAKILCKNSTTIQGYDLETIWNEYLTLYTNDSSYASNPDSVLNYNNIGIGSAAHYTTTGA